MLTELQDYYIQKTSHSKNVIIQSSRQSELLADVYRKLIEQTSPYLTTDQWIKMSGIYIFEKIKNRQSTDEKDNKIRSLLNRFDYAVNPFNNEKVELLDPSYYVDKVNIDISSYTDKANFDIKKCIIEDKIIGIKVNYYICQYLLRYSISTSDLSIKHQFIWDEKYIDLQDEFIEIKNKENTSKKFSLTRGILYENEFFEDGYFENGEKIVLTVEDKSLIISELQQAIEKAEMVTIKNMTTPKMQNARKRSLNKN